MKLTHWSYTACLTLLAVLVPLSQAQVGVAVRDAGGRHAGRSRFGDGRTDRELQGDPVRGTPGGSAALACTAASHTVEGRAGGDALWR